MAVLGISASTRLLSIAIISQNELIKYTTHFHKSSWSPAKRDGIVASLEPCVLQYCIRKVVLSIPHAHYQTKEHKNLVNALTMFFQTQNIPVTVKTPEALAAFCPEGKKKSKKALMKSIVDYFPELRMFYVKELRNRTKYYHKLFEAVAVAVLGAME